MIRRVAWFIVVGCLAAAVHLGAVVLLVSGFGWQPLVANVVAWLLAFCVSFSGHWHLTFPHSGAPMVRDVRRAAPLSEAEIADLLKEVESEGGRILGIDLGSMLNGERGRDVNIRLAARVAATPGWEIHCHAMVSNGSAVRRFYIGRQF